MGNALSQSFPPKSLFSVEQIPDLTGQVIIVTGGNAGVGKETCKASCSALLNKNAKVYLAARSKSRADDAIEWLKSETNGKAPIFLELDLGNLASVRKAAEEFKR
ncbi:short chain dehydrogenase domain-containing protein [Rhizoctonia solani AG-1 IA]|uniref:Short chain dehydrogenase domain-containing protein n=1 Tax=Thanatephorus cucumeris (strain AG1-IA) TaxID=983506 RepID=L8WD72_THACA|nr:short chain dehydrogenase domain-containing protein [Rhizoctonia solani AG-1 IA]